VLLLARMSRSASGFCGGGWARGGTLNEGSGGLNRREQVPPWREKPLGDPSLRRLSLSSASTLSALVTTGADVASGDQSSKESKCLKGVKGKPPVPRPVHSAGSNLTQRGRAPAHALDSLAPPPARSSARHVSQWEITPGWGVMSTHSKGKGIPGLQQVLERCASRSKVFCGGK